ncbi:hypothetical protein BCV70DRAFT_197240 [Testicularia cyperi]|uniref:Mid2 domain-containing protein n=1 Tax=Testicularia cyperi TaxID=1882483 RepID=A0A317XY05_9BASI|nr:hypothetical protein BCV70DRAFT_197240 [Testicularia cyperi]
MLHLFSPLMAAASLLLVSHASALSFGVRSVNCSSIDWTITINATEWSVAPFINLFFISQSAGQNYSLSFSAQADGQFPGAGTFTPNTSFGNTVISGSYRIGAGLADENGKLLTTSEAVEWVSTVALDPRIFPFTNCGSSSTSATSSSTTSRATSTSTSSARPSSTAAGAATGASTASASSQTAKSSAAASASSSQGSSNNAGAIAGGIVGGLAALLILFFLVRFCRSRRRTQRLRNEAAFAGEGYYHNETGQGAPMAEAAAHSAAVSRIPSVDYRSAGDIAVLARLQRRSGDQGSRRSSSKSAHTASKAYAADTETEEEIKVVQVPFALSVPRRASHTPSSRPVSTPGASPEPVSASASGSFGASHSRSASSPYGAGEGRTLAAQRSQSSFKIPRVSVPAYLLDEEAAAAQTGSNTAPPSPTKWADHTFAPPPGRRGSGVTFQSTDDDKFRASHRSLKVSATVLFSSLLNPLLRSLATLYSTAYAPFVPPSPVGPQRLLS